MHRLGYRYTGPGSLYSLTVNEVMRLNRGAEVSTLRDSGTPISQLDKLEQFERKQRAKA